MKTTMKILSLLLVLVLALFTFAGCVTVEPGEGEEVIGGKTYVTITWMQGQRLIKEEVVEKGTLLNDWTPEGSGEFKGWYERPYIKKFDFTKPVTKSMIIYASFVGGDDGGTGTTETPDWYLIGAGKGDLGKCNNWNHEAAAANLGLYAGEDGIYRVTLSLYEGDQFKMTNNFGWDNERQSTRWQAMLTVLLRMLAVRLYSQQAKTTTLLLLKVWTVSMKSHTMLMQTLWASLSLKHLRRCPTIFV